MMPPGLSAARCHRVATYLASQGIYGPPRWPVPQRRVTADSYLGYRSLLPTDLAKFRALDTLEGEMRSVGR
jgi:hypothetical protein